MRKVVVSMFVTLDGVMQAPGSEEHPYGKGGWSMSYFSEDMGEQAFEVLRGAEALLLGRVSYEHFAEAWPAMTDKQGFAERMNTIPKYVVTSTHEELTWNAHPLRGDAATEVLRLKEERGGDLLILGSGRLVHALADAGLIDEYHLFVHPVVVGSGTRLFGEGADLTRLRLTASKTFSEGVVLLSYRLGDDDRGGPSA